MLKDMHLWEIVKRRFAPLGQPSTGTRYQGGFAVACPEMIDLHGLTVQEAHERVRHYLIQATYGRLKRVTVITGRSGQIRQEFPTWAKLHPDVRSIRELNGGGAFEVRLRPLPPP